MWLGGDLGDSGPQCDDWPCPIHLGPEKGGFYIQQHSLSCSNFKQSQFGTHLSKWFLQILFLSYQDRSQKYCLQPEILTINQQSKFVANRGTFWYIFATFVSFCLNLLFSLPYDKKLAFIFQTPRGLRPRGVINSKDSISKKMYSLFCQLDHLV